MAAASTMDDPRSSRGREGGAQRDLTAPSDLGTKPGEWKDLGEVSRGQQSVYLRKRKIVMDRLSLLREL